MPIMPKYPPELPLSTLFTALSPKQQRKALTASMRTEATRLKRAAVANVKSSGLSTKTNVQRGVYSRVYPKRYGLGFLISVKPHGLKGIHTNRQGRQKPVLMFAEEGTQPRNVGRRKGAAKFQKGKYATKAYRTYSRSGHSTGRMKKYGFMDKTFQHETEGVEIRLFTEFEKNVDKAANSI